jgi:hypothetical protein
MEVRESDFVEVTERVPGILTAACLPITAVIASNFVYQAGAVTVLAMPNDGGLLTLALKASIMAALRAGLFIDVEKNNALFVEDFARTAINVGYTVKPNSGISSATCIAACDAAIQTFLDPRTWPSGRTVKVFEIGSVLEALSEVDSVDAIIVNGGNAVLLNPYAVPFVSGLNGGTV